MCHVLPLVGGQTLASATTARYCVMMRLYLFDHLAMVELSLKLKCTQDLPLEGATRLLLDHGSSLLERSLKSTRDAS